MNKYEIADLYKALIEDDSWEPDENVRKSVVANLASKYIGQPLNFKPSRN